MANDFVFEPTYNIPLFDTHAHYTDDRFKSGHTGGKNAIITTLLSQNVKHIVNAGTSVESSLEGIAMAEEFPQLYATAGIHPGEIPEDEDIESVMDAIRECLRHPKVRALGEIGLDYHYDEPERDVQKKWFRRQLELAREMKMPVVIHDREAHGDIMDILREYPDVTGEFHCFSGSAELARQLVSRGWYISFAGVITYKNAAKALEVVPTVPLDSILIETDAPYLAPEPKRGKLNHSGLMEFTAARAAELYGIPLEDFCRHAYENACRFFGIEE